MGAVEGHRAVTQLAPADLRFRKKKKEKGEGYRGCYKEKKWNRGRRMRHRKTLEKGQGGFICSLV